MKMGGLMWCRVAVAVALVAGGSPGSHAQDAIPSRLPGPDLTTLRGWLAGIYPSWPYVPDQSTVHPVGHLWSPGEPQSFGQAQYAAQQLQAYGSAADVVQYNPNPLSPDHNELLRIYFGHQDRPFFLLYEHLHGTRFDVTPALSPTGNDASFVDMDNPHNRITFMHDLDLMFRRVIVPNQDRYVTVDGRAVIYMWTSGALRGDIAGLLRDAKAQYPVFFLGSEEIAPPSNDPVAIARVAELDGFMPYSVHDPLNQGDYVRMTVTYRQRSAAFRAYLTQIDAGTGRRHLLIPTFQPAFDNSRVLHARRPDGTLKVTPLYPRSREELIFNAQILRNGMTVDHIFDPIGPFAVYSEFYEGAAVAESVYEGDRAGRYVGYGSARLDVLQEFFSTARIAAAVRR